MSAADGLALLDAELTADQPEPPEWLVFLARLICCPSCGGRTQPPVFVGDSFAVAWPHDDGCPDRGTALPLRDPFKEW